jgi:hypothetical protein
LEDLVYKAVPLPAHAILRETGKASRMGGGYRRVTSKLYWMKSEYRSLYAVMLVRRTRLGRLPGVSLAVIMLVSILQSLMLQPCGPKHTVEGSMPPHRPLFSPACPFISGSSIYDLHQKRTFILSMSGFEVVGVILAVYPIIVNTLQLYKETTESKLARSLEKSLKAEEFLYDGVVASLASCAGYGDDEVTDNMKIRQDAFWKDDEIHAKLSKSLGERKARLVLDILQEIKQDLDAINVEVSNKAAILVC